MVEHPTIQRFHESNREAKKTPPVLDADWLK